MVPPPQPPSREISQAEGYGRLMSTGIFEGIRYPFDSVPLVRFESTLRRNDFIDFPREKKAS